MITTTDQMDIIDTAIASGNLNTFLYAVKAADLVEAFKAQGPFTVFVPDDSAFLRLSVPVIESLLDPTNGEKLIGILTYHVICGKLSSSEIRQLAVAKTVNGQRIGIKTAGQDVLVNGVKITRQDIECSNGVVHIIDSVLMPD